MYCSNENGDDCTHLETLVRVGLPFTHFFGLEDLFYKVCSLLFNFHGTVKGFVAPPGLPIFSQLRKFLHNHNVFSLNFVYSMASMLKSGPMSIRTNDCGQFTNMKYSMDRMKSRIKTLEHRFMYVLPSPFVLFSFLPGKIFAISSKPRKFQITPRNHPTLVNIHRHFCFPDCNWFSRMQRRSWALFEENPCVECIP